MLRLPRIAYSAELPVSPDVAPRMLIERPSRASTYSNRLPSSCSAMSLNASVGPLDTRSRCRPGSSVSSGVMSSLPKVSRVYVPSTIRRRSAGGNVVDEARQDREGELAVAERPQRRQLRRA